VVATPRGVRWPSHTVASAPRRKPQAAGKMRSRRLGCIVMEWERQPCHFPVDLKEEEVRRLKKAPKHGRIGLHLLRGRDEPRGCG